MIIGDEKNAGVLTSNPSLTNKHTYIIQKGN